ncbi:cleavage and polyadenylation specificity factor subunit 1-like [Stylophora pistillata]|uniref:cleavage and polyadenylation specificity factor subunit 1-like n=1 Tax=Stylophora pistillata TaxID=50429 RepID=UPI000C05354C|nr:cleavage and polyadenylation specificity factor subunit 1-like [Stylophora pistillata]
MYAIYKQTHPPTGIEHCEYCQFFSSAENNLVVAGTSQLRIYKFYTQDEHTATGTAPSDKTVDGATKRRKLELVSQYSLFGNIECLKAVRLAGNSRDSLLLSFKDAKFAVVDYDPGTHDLKTRSLHYFEDDKITKSCNQEYFRPPMVCVDPDRRCAVMLIYGTHIVVLPFRQEGVLEEHEQEGTFTASGDRSPLLPSYTINLKDIHEKLCNIIDIQFLHGYYEPTLLILYEPLQTWPGRLAMRHDTCALVAVSLNLSQRTYPVVWSLNNLPFDCSQVLAVPKPIGGVLVCATNSLLYLNQSVPPYGVSLNSIAEHSTDFPLNDLDELEVYGKEEQSGVKLTSYTFEVSDSLLNIGPCTSVDMGEPAFLLEEFSGSKELDLELVSCSGYGKNGALSVLQRSVRPQVVTTFELPGCVDMWTVLSGEQVC